MRMRLDGGFVAAVFTISPGLMDVFFSAAL
jgi:hypothetical protein